MTMLSKGVLFYTWVAAYPTGLFYPLNKDPLELLGTISQTLTIVIPGFGLIYMVYKVIKKRKIIFTQGVIVANLILWMAYCIIFMWEGYYQAPPELSIQDEVFILTLPAYLQALCMLIGMLTEMYVLDKLVLNLSAKYSILSYIAIFMLNLGLEGWVSPLYPALVNLFANGDPDLFLMSVGWKKRTESVQILLWFIFGTATCIAVTIRILLYDRTYRAQSIIGKLLAAFKDVYLLVPLILHLFSIACFYIANYMVANTTVAGNDRAQTGLIEFENFFLSGHMYITCFSFDYFKTTLQRAIDKRGKPTTAKESQSSKGKPIPLKQFIDSEASKQSTKTVNDKGTIKM
ncbi:hypothetical protein HDV01_007135 [Terramyces sp. JEL0728]|nr:hypothetical protein HDV01_007135 [Terramyces sp. JEL0728]